MVVAVFNVQGKNLCLLVAYILHVLRILFQLVKPCKNTLSNILADKSQQHLGIERHVKSSNLIFKKRELLKNTELNSHSLY